jgi:hypothetical protein
MSVSILVDMNLSFEAELSAGAVVVVEPAASRVRVLPL